MSCEKRSAFHQQVVEALLASKAINLEAVGATMSKFGERAVREGESLVQIINRNVMWNCGWPGPEIDLARGQARQLGE
jgi:hypothetical protein